MLHDSLSRLANVKKIELLKANGNISHASNKIHHETDIANIDTLIVSHKND